jgi:ketosteroid isomerase-like protein
MSDPTNGDVVRHNADVVRRTYEAVGRGDIPAVLALLTDDVEWTLQGPSVIPFARTRYGREGVSEFFSLVAETLEFQQFEPCEFVAQGDTVVVLGYERNLIKPTGRTFSASSREGSAPWTAASRRTTASRRCGSRARSGWARPWPRRRDRPRPETSRTSLQEGRCSSSPRSARRRRFLDGARADEYPFPLVRRRVDILVEAPSRARTIVVLALPCVAWLHDGPAEYLQDGF